MLFSKNKIFVIKLFALCVFYINTNAAIAEESTSSSANTLAEHFRFMRYDEDFSYLDTQEERIGLEKIKNIALGNQDWKISFGGSLRERYENYSHENFGVPQKDGDGYLISRLLLHTDLKKADDFRAFIEIGSTLATDKENANIPYEDKLDLYQAFIDVNLKENNIYDQGFIRLGRQEMAFGDQRLISVRDAPGVRRTFDGIRMNAKKDDFKYDLFYTQPVRLEKGVWDDSSNQDQNFWGAYTTNNTVFDSNFNLDLYYLGIKNDLTAFTSLTGEEERHSIGYRIFGKHNNFDFDFENLYQFGDFAKQDIQAWGFTLDTGYNLDILKRTRIGFKLTSSSGDKNPNDNKLETYNGLFPKMAYFNQAGLLGTQNIIDLQPNIMLQVSDHIKISLAHDFLWRQTTHDAVYTATGRPLVNTINQGNKYISGQSSLDIDWKVNPSFALNGGLVYVDVSDSFKEAGGNNTSFTYLSMTYMF